MVTICHKNSTGFTRGTEWYDKKTPDNSSVSQRHSEVLHPRKLISELLSLINSFLSFCAATLAECNLRYRSVLSSTNFAVHMLNLHGAEGFEFLIAFAGAATATSGVAVVPSHTMFSRPAGKRFCARCF